MKIPHTETPQSSNIAHFAYDGTKLIVGFKRKVKGSGEEQIDIYEHHGGADEIAQDEVEQHAQAMLSAHLAGDSVGSYFARNVRGRYISNKLAPEG